MLRTLLPSAARSRRLPLSLVVLLALLALALGSTAPARAATATPNLFVAIGGGGFDGAHDLAVDTAGNLYVSGFFAGTVGFGGGVVLSAEATDSFVARYRPDGTLVWVAQVGGPGFQRALKVAVDASGNVAVAGDFVGSATIRSAATSAEPGRRQQLAAQNPAADLATAFVARFRPDGTVDWAARGLSPGDSFATGLDVDALGNLYVSGTFDGSVELLPAGGAPGSGQTLRVLAPQEISDVFLARYNSNGALAWARGAGSIDTDRELPSFVAVDSSGIYLAGSFAGTAEFRAGSVTRRLISAGSDDIFVARYSNLGALLWLARFGNTEPNNPADIDVSANGIYVAGTFGREFVGGALVGEIAVKRLAISDGREVGSTLTHQASPGALAVAPSGDVYIGGTIVQQARFGREAQGALTLSHSGQAGLFVAGFSGDLATPRVAAASAGNTTRASVGGIAVDAQSNPLLTGAFEGQLILGDRTASAFGHTTAYLTRFAVSGTSASPPPAPNPTPEPAPAPILDPAEGVIYLSTSAFASAGGLSFNDEDVVAFNPRTRQYSMLIDGSDLGLGSADLDAFEWLDDNSQLMSFRESLRLPGIAEEVDDSDIVRFIPSRLGTTTEGRFELFFDGSDVGLTADGEDVDAIAFALGHLQISTFGGADVPGPGGTTLPIQDNDVIQLGQASFGANTAGVWSLRFDGAQAGFTTTSEDVTALWHNGSSGTQFLISTNGIFALNGGASGDGRDIITCDKQPTGPESCRAQLFFDGSVEGLSGTIDAIAIGLQGVLGEVEPGGDDPAQPEPGDDPLDDPDLLQRVYLPTIAR